MKIKFFEIPFIVKFFILGFMIMGATIIQRSGSVQQSSLTKNIIVKSKDTIFTNTSVPVPILVSPQSKNISEKSPN